MSARPPIVPLIANYVASTGSGLRTHAREALPTSTQREGQESTQPWADPKLLEAS